MADSLTISKAELYGRVIEKLTGEKPYINYYKNHAEIRFTKKQTEKLRNMATKEGKSDIKIDYIPVYAPLVIKKLIPLFAGVFIAGLIISRV